MNEKFERAMDRIKLWAGKCDGSTELQNAKDAVTLANKRIDEALHIGDFLKMDSRIKTELVKAQGYLKEIEKGIGTIKKICKATNAIFRIRSAVRVLSDPDIINKDPEKAARNFGEIFVGFGELCEFSEILKSYGEFLRGMGDFFVNLRYGIVPELKKTHKRVNDELVGGGDRPLW